MAHVPVAQQLIDCCRYSITSPNQLSISARGLTRKGCPYTLKPSEHTFVDLLERAENFSVADLYLTIGVGTEKMLFKGESGEREGRGKGS